MANRNLFLGHANRHRRSAARRALPRFPLARTAAATRYRYDALHIQLLLELEAAYNSVAFVIICCIRNWIGRRLHMRAVRSFESWLEFSISPSFFFLFSLARQIFRNRPDAPAPSGLDRQQQQQPDRQQQPKNDVSEKKEKPHIIDARRVFFFSSVDFPGKYLFCERRGDRNGVAFDDICFQ